MATKKCKKGSDGEGSICFRANSKDGKKLEVMLKKGVISQGIPPKMATELHPEFKKCNLESFHGVSRRMHNKHGLNVHPIVATAGEYACDGTLFKRYVHKHELTILFLSVSTDDDDDDDSEDDELVIDSDDDESIDPCLNDAPANKTSAAETWADKKFSAAALGSGIELIVNEEEVWIPIRLMKTWKNLDQVWHVAMLLVLPSGIACETSNDVTLGLEKGATELVIAVSWCKWLLDLDFLDMCDKNEKALSAFHLFHAVLEECLSEIHGIDKGAPVKSVARIPLPIEVHPCIEPEDWCFLGEEAGRCRVIVIDLEAPASETYEEREICCCVVDKNKKNNWQDYLQPLSATHQDWSEF